jgi:hypothetical protein
MSLQLRFREQLQCRDAAAAQVMEMSALEIARKCLKKREMAQAAPKQEWKMGKEERMQHVWIASE